MPDLKSVCTLLIVVVTPVFGALTAQITLASHTDLSSGSATSAHSTQLIRPICLICPICKENTTQSEHSIHCRNEHFTCIKCIENQIESTENISDLKNGIRCTGDVSHHSATSSKANYERCEEILPLDQIQELIGESQRQLFNKRLLEAEKPTDQTIFDQEVKRLSKNIQEAFNLCCPVEGCGVELDQIEGCNAAICSNRQCGAYFCYLCGDTQQDRKASHLHVRAMHSDDAWEHRSGYLDRYHWLLTRKILTSLFRAVIDPAIRESVLNTQRSFLEEKNMWPFPAGLMTPDWIEAVNRSSLDQEKKIVILQNEAIFQRRECDPRKRSNHAQKQKIELLDAEIRRLGGTVLASLDVRDQEGVHLPGSNPRPALVIAPLVISVPPEAERLREMLDDHRVTPAFALLGNMYEAFNLIWSGASPNPLTWKDAKRFCENLNGGARLPTADEYRKLVRSLPQGGPYNPHLFPDMNGNLFWSLSHHADKAIYTNGTSGSLNCTSTQLKMKARCVRTTADLNEVPEQAQAKHQSWIRFFKLPF